MRRRLGQHFLKNKAALKNIAAALEIRAGDTVLEIGPGHGELTGELLSRDPGRLIVFERDPKLAEKIGLLHPKIEVRKGNALDLLPDATAELEDYLLAGNIPYYITGHLLRTLGELSRKPRLTVLVIQREVAERIVASPPRMNRLAASVQVWASPRILFFLKAREFSPPPDVDSAVILLRPHGRPAPKNIDLVLREVFSQPRKTIFNNLRRLGEKSSLETRLRDLGIDPGLRPQDLSLEDIHNIATLLP